MGSRTNETMGLCLVVGHVFNQINTEVAVEARALSFTWVRTLTEKAGSQESHRACCLTEAFPKLRCPESFPSFGSPRV